MAIRKCPRCELNYILDAAPYCPVCSREMKGEADRSTPYETCSICNENPALPGKDLCLFCLKEMEKNAEASQGEGEAPFENPLELEGASEMEELTLDGENDIPTPELGEIDRELSLDDVLAEEESSAEEEGDREEDV